MHRISSKSDSIIQSLTTNAAESFMAVRCSLDGGKQVNRSQRGSWSHRCHGAVLRYNIGHQWNTTVYSEIFPEAQRNLIAEHHFR